MLPSTRISAAQSFPRQRTATANSARPPSSSCLSPQMPFNPGLLCTLLREISWKPIVPSLGGQWVLPDRVLAPLPAGSTGLGWGSLCPCTWSDFSGLPPNSWGFQQILGAPSRFSGLPAHPGWPADDPAHYPPRGVLGERGPGHKVFVSFLINICG